MRSVEVVGEVPDESARHREHVLVGIDTHALFYVIGVIVALVGILVALRALCVRRRKARDMKKKF